MTSQILSTVGHFPIKTGALAEWNTILLTPVNRWLYDCLFLLQQQAVGIKYDPPIQPPIFMTQKALLSVADIQLNSRHQRRCHGATAAPATTILEFIASVLWTVASQQLCSHFRSFDKFTSSIERYLLWNWLVNLFNFTVEKEVDPLQFITQH